MLGTKVVLAHAFQQVSASLFIAQENSLVIALTFPVGTFTVTNQPMFPKSHVNSTDLTSRLPDGTSANIQCDYIFCNTGIAPYITHLKEGVLRHTLIKSIFSFKSLKSFLFFIECNFSSSRITITYLPNCPKFFGHCDPINFLLKNR